MQYLKQLFTGLIFLSIVGCMNIAGDCKNEIFQTSSNNYNDYKIIKFDRGCGATTGNSIQVSIIPCTGTLKNSEGGNTFIAGMKGYWNESDTAVICTWISNDEMLIQYDSTLTLFKKEAGIGHIQIKYRSK